MKRLLVAVLLLSVMHAAACGRQTAHDELPALPSDTAGLLPAPSDLPRSASFVATGQRRDGDQYEAEPAQLVQTLYGDAYFSPTWQPGDPVSEVGFALYRFNLTGYTGNAELDLHFKSPPAAGSVFVAAADWAADAWSWYAWDNAPIDLVDLAPFTNGSNELLLAVVVLGDQTNLSLGHITIGPRWHDFLVYDNPFSHGVVAADFAFVNGVPCVAVIKPVEEGSFHTELVYVRAGDTEGKTWEEPVLVPGGAAADTVSLLEYDGKPIMAVGRVVFTTDPPAYDPDVVCIAAADADGTTWNDLVEVRLDGEALAPQLLELEDGSLGMAYNWAATIGTLNDTAQFANSPDGSVWTSHSIGAGVINNSIKATLVEGHPAICWQAPGFALGYTRSTSPDGSTWSGGATLDSGGTVGFAAGIGFIEGWPAAVYDAAGQSEVRVVRAQDAEGALWGTPETVHTAPFDGYASGYGMTEIDGTPAFILATADSGDPGLPDHTYSLVQAADDAATSWLPPLPIRERDLFEDDTDNYIRVTEVVEINGAPAALYADSNKEQVFFSLYY